MTTSIESEALRDAFRSFAARLADDPDTGLPALRDMFDSLSYQQKEPPGVTYEEVALGTRSGLWVRPIDAEPDRVILYTHGGGYIAHTASTSRKLVGHLAKAAGATAFVPDYRIAPESPFPAQLEDAVAAYSFLLDQGFDASRIAIAGESAGGNLAAGTVLRLGELGLPRPAALVGFSPWFDLLGELETFDSNASRDVFLSRDVSAMMAGMFLGEGVSAHAPLANPLHADLGGFPPTYLTAGSEETLLASVLAFAEKAEGVGVDVTTRIGDGMQHAFQWMAGRAPEADESISACGAWIGQKLRAA